MNFHTTVMFILIFGTTVFGQTMIPPDGNPRSNNKTVFEYTTAKDETLVRSPLLVLYKSEGRGLLVGELLAASVRFKFAGRNLTAPPLMLELRFFSESNNTWKFEKENSRQIAIIVDGENILTGTLERITSEGYHTINASMMRFNETLIIPLKFEEFSKIANGKEVVIQVGKNNKFKLSKSNVEVLQTFLKSAKG